MQARRNLLADGRQRIPRRHYCVLAVMSLGGHEPGGMQARALRRI